MMVEPDKEIFGSDFLRRYLEVAPAALAIERYLECRLLSRGCFDAPILDLGCGDGVFAKILFKNRVDLGIDIDPAEIARARRTDMYDDLITCPGDKIPVAAGTYRTIFSNSVLEHIPDVLPVLREAHRVLHPDGRVHITVPGSDFERFSLVARVLSGLGLHETEKRYRVFYNRFWRHFHAYDTAGWTRMFADAGFKVESAAGYDSAGVCTLNDVLTVPAVPAMIAKRLFDRWILWPALREKIAPALAALLEPVVGALERPDRPSGLLYFVLVKDSG